MLLHVPDEALGGTERIQRLLGQSATHPALPDLSGLAADLAGPDLAIAWNRVATGLLAMYTQCTPIALPDLPPLAMADRFDLEWTVTYWLLRHAQTCKWPDLPPTEDRFFWLELDEHAETIYLVRTGTWAKEGRDPYPYSWWVVRE